MYVCLCNGHTDRDLAELAAQGVETVDEAYARLGAPAACGHCLEFAQAVLNDARSRRLSEQTPPLELTVSP